MIIRYRGYALARAGKTFVVSDGAASWTFETWDAAIEWIDKAKEQGREGHQEGTPQEAS